MNSEQIYRTILIVLFLVSLSVSIYFRRTAQASSGDKIDRRLEGNYTMIALRIGGILTWFSIIAYTIYPPLVSWASFHLPDLVRWAGVGTGVLAVVLLIWMFRSLGSNITDSVTIRTSHSLVTDGPYRWIRHPLYTFGFLLFFSFSLIANNWLVLVFGFPTFGILLWRTRTEEAALQARFGDEYSSYSERTGRFLPRLG